MTVRRILALVLVGVLGGILSGMFGVGGGIIMVPLLTILAGMDQRRAVPESFLLPPELSATLFAILILAAVAQLIYRAVRPEKSARLPHI